MNSNKRKNNNRWMISLAGFTPEKKEALFHIAKKHRQSLCSYIGNLLDAEIQKHEGSPPID